MKLPSITQKQQTILILLYRHRFLERKQIQSLLGHTNKSRTIRWLKELREQEFIDWIYDADPTAISKPTPAIYFLSVNGIRLLRQLGYDEAELRKRYKDGNRQQDFIDRCLLLAGCAIHLEAKNKDGATHYIYALEADYTDPDNDYNLLSESEYIRPDLAFTKEAETDEAYINQTYIMQVFDPTMPRYMVKKKLSAYLEYFDSPEPEEWVRQFGQEEQPIVLIVCPTIAELIYAKRYIKRELDDAWGGDIPEEIKIRLTVLDKLKKRSMTAVIWEDVY